jgi:hypothetical protein
VVAEVALHLAARRRIVEAAETMLAGKLSFIEGARLICDLRSMSGLANDDPDIVPFRGIDTETDTLPLGKLWELWAADAWEKLEPEIDSAEKWAEEIGREACRSLVRRFDGAAE